MSPLMTSADDYALHLRAAMHEIEAQDISAFHAFTDEEVERCLNHSNVIECAAGDRVLKKGGVARNIFVVLDGTLEARDGEQVVGVIRTRRGVRRDGVPARAPADARRLRRQRLGAGAQPEREHHPQDGLRRSRASPPSSCSTSPGCSACAS